MPAIIAFILLLTGLPFLLLTVKGHTFEETIPLSVAGKILLLFGLGIIGCLKLGIYVIIVLALLEYAYGIWWVLKNKCLKEKVCEFFDAGWLCWLIAVALICYCMRGKLFDSWDEFSHWGDIVKVMASLDDFGTNPNSASTFKSYPPGMALFQYLLEKVSQITSGMQFKEWLVYAAYQTFVVSFMLPILFKCKKVFHHSVFFVPVALIAIFFGQQMFGSGVYRWLYIDPVLGTLFACGLAEILYQNEKPKLHFFYMAAVCSMLTLAKDAGLLFAIMLFVADTILVLFGKKNKEEKLTYIVATALFTFLPVALWRLHMHIRSIARTFSGKYDLKDFFNVVTHKKTSYRTTVCQCFKQLFFSDSCNIAGFTIPTYLLILAAMVLVLVLLIFGVKRKEVKGANAIIVYLTLGFTTIVYIWGMLLSYMYKFSEYEASYCASFQRYIYTIYEAIWLFLIFTVLISLPRAVNKRIITVLVSAILLLVSPKENIGMTISRTAVSGSEDFRSQYDAMSYEVIKYCDNQDRVFLISEGDDGLDSIVLKLTVRPITLGNSPWSFGEETYEGDIYTADYTVEQIQELWETGNYDYVAIYRLNENFLEKYADLFADEDEIMENKVYKINENYMLELCE